MLGIDSGLKVTGVEAFHDQSNAFSDSKICEKANQAREDDAGAPM